MVRLLTLVGALVAGALIAWTVQQPPRPKPPTAPAATFSAQRALADIRTFAAKPHPVGSDADHAARDVLLARMAALGLTPEVHRGVGLTQSKAARNVLFGGNVENLIGVLPGRDRNAPALALMAHYDSVPGSPGAADDAAGVSSALEIVRAIKAQGVPARDVMLVITDGEEAGLLGASAFFRSDPAARHVGFVINMEARGSAGRVQMFETAADNGGAIRLLQRTARRPQSTSLTVFVYQHMPNDTDFSEAKKAGVPGLNFAFVGRQFDYHSPTSTPATTDLRTLQDLGSQALSAARGVAFAPALPARSPSLVYSHVFGDLLLAYPPAVGWLILLGAAGLLGIAVARTRRVEAFPWTDILRGAGAALFAVAGAISVLHFARRATGVSFGFLDQRFLLAQVTRWETTVVLLALGFLLASSAELARGRRQIAFIPLAAGLASSLFGGFDPVGLGMGLTVFILGLGAYGRPVSRAAAWAGVLLLGLGLAVIAQAAAPMAAASFAWPLALAALAAAATDLSTRRGVLTMGLLGGLAAIGIGWLGGYVHAAFISLDLVELIPVAGFGAALLVWPLAQPAEGAPPERLIGPALLIVGLALIVSVRVNDPYDARHPQASIIIYQADQDAGRAWLVSATPERPAWADTVLRSRGGQITKLRSWVWPRPADAAPAPLAPEPTPDITLAKRPDGGLLLHAAPPAGGRQLVLGLVPNTPMTTETVGGVATKISLTPGHRTRVFWSAAPDGVDILLRPAGPGKLTVDYQARLDGWPAELTPAPPRPPTVMAFGDSDTTLLTGTRRFTW